MSAASLAAAAEGDHVALLASGAWTVERATELERLIEDASRRHAGARSIDIDLAGLERLDTFGAWLIERLKRSFLRRGSTARITGLSETDRALMAELRAVNQVAFKKRAAPNAILVALNAVGRNVAEIGGSLALVVQLLGALVLAALGTIAHPRRLRFTSIVHHLEKVGLRAVPIIVLSTFMIGAILAQQGIFRFRTFGAVVFVVGMVGILVLREVGVLIVCVMVAGRSGSAYTAELGAMKMREEIDALRTMGLDPVEVLVLPRIVALVIAVPLLTFLGSMAALYGAGLVCWLYGGMTPEIFLERLRQAIWMPTFAVGMIKAPFMALTIGLVACVEGFNVEGSAASLGRKTTASVVKSIFLVIVLDGFFAMFLARSGCEDDRQRGGDQRARSRRQLRRGDGARPRHARRLPRRDSRLRRRFWCGQIGVDAHDHRPAAQARRHHRGVRERFRQPRRPRTARRRAALGRAVPAGRAVLLADRAAERAVPDPRISQPVAAPDRKSVV
jgi:phospholipid/cholesterol/gamma-HCH transport system permease protein